MRILMAANIPKTIPAGERRRMENMAEEIKKLGHEVHCVFAEEVILPLTSYSHHNLFRAIEFPLLLVKKIVSLERKRGHFDIVDIVNKEGYLFGLLRKTLGMRSKYILRCIDPEIKNIPAKASRYYKKYDHKIPDSLAIPPKIKFWFPYLYQKQERMALLKSDKIVVMCEEDRSIVASATEVDPSKVALVPLGTGKEFFEIHRNESDLEGDFLYVGSCTEFWGKLEGIDLLAEAFPQVVRRFPKAKLTIVGCRNIDKTGQYFPAFLRKNMKIYPFVPRQRLIKLYKEHKILVHPSLSEGFGVVFLDGMAAGLTVIATPVGGAADICEDGKDSIMVPPGDSRSLANAMTFLLENQDICAEIGKRGREKAKKYTWEETAIKTVKIYEDALDEL